MKIGELARSAGLNASAIRYYEKVGLISPPYRSSGQRRYAQDSLDRVLLIRFASDMGFTLSEIKLFLRGLRDNAPVGTRWKNLANRKIKEVEQSIERSRRLKSLLEHLLHCRCPSLQVCVQRLSLSPDLCLLGRPQTQIRQGRTKIGNNMASAENNTSGNKMKPGWVSILEGDD
ncbi:MAG TPA: MerR family transcriptional regulator [Candidatus Acidoferrum sp.]|jgi:DNA-binding transcriptional MerR regulator